MRQSPNELARTLNAWHAASQLTITESNELLVVAGLSATAARQTVSLLSAEGWPIARLEDGTESLIEAADIHDDFAPYKVTTKKPAAPAGVSLIVTLAGLEDWLSRGPITSTVQIADLNSAFETYSVRFAPWGDTTAFDAQSIGGDPRRIVREAAAERRLVGNLSHWLLRDAKAFEAAEPAAKVWARRSAALLVQALATEIEPDDVLMFKGPPVVRLKGTASSFDALGDDGFRHVQEAGRWVYENEREAETRHSLFVAEVARTASASRDVGAALKTAAGPALEGARIAFQLGLSQLSRDALKAMADLRKAVSDETTKLSEATRQLATAVTGALFAGIGVLVARLTVAFTSTEAVIALAALGVVLSLYVAAVILSGLQFLKLQSELRDQWRDKLYRFLPDQEYRVMVTEPVSKAEKGFRGSALISALLTVILLIATLVAACQPRATASYNTLPAARPTKEEVTDAAEGLEQTQADQAARQSDNGQAANAAGASREPSKAGSGRPAANNTAEDLAPASAGNARHTQSGADPGGEQPRDNKDATDRRSSEKVG